MLHLQEVARKTTRTAESAHQKSHPERLQRAGLGTERLTDGGSDPD